MAVSLSLSVCLPDCPPPPPPPISLSPLGDQTSRLNVKLSLCLCLCLSAFPPLSLSLSSPPPLSLLPPPPPSFSMYLSLARSVRRQIDKVKKKTHLQRDTSRTLDAGIDTQVNTWTHALLFRLGRGSSHDLYHFLTLSCSSASLIRSRCLSICLCLSSFLSACSYLCVSF